MAYLLSKKQTLKNGNKPAPSLQADKFNELVIPAINGSDIFEKSDNDFLIDLTDDLLWSVNCDLKLITANKAFTEYLREFAGITVKPGDELLVKSVFAAEFIVFWELSYKRALAGESFKEEIYTPAFKNSKPVWAETSFSPIQKAGAIVGVACFSRLITERKFAEEKLTQSEAHLAEAQRLAKLGSWNFDIKADRLTWSEELYNVFGTDKQTFIETHSSFTDLVDEADREFVLQTSKQTQKTGKPFTIEYNITTPKGEKRIIREHGYGVVDDDGNVIRLFGTAQDITEPKKYKESLQKAYEEKNTILERIDDGFFALDKNSIVTYWNKRAEILLNAKREEVIGKNLHEVFANHTSLAFYDNYQKAMLENSTVHFVEFSTRTNKWFAVSAYGSENGLSVYFEDVTEQKNAGEKLKESELRYRLLVEQAADAICITDASYKFIDINSSGCKMFGYSREEFLQFYITDVLFAEDLVANPIKAEDLTARKPVVNERRVKRKDGSVLLIELSSKMLDDGRIMIFGRDISERKESERLVKESEAKYRAFFKSSMDGILLTVTDGEILSANPAACGIFKMTEAEICAAGRFGLTELTDPRLYLLLEERRKTGRAKGELTLLRKDGSTFEAELTSAVFTDSYGRQRTSMIIRDISERKAAEFNLTQTTKELKHTLNDLNKIMDFSMDIICTIDEAGKFVQVSAATQAIWGYSPQELVNIKYASMLYADDVKKTAAIDNEIKNGVLITMFENRFVHKNGSIVPMLWSAKWDEQDGLMYCIGKNATEIKRLEKANEIERQRFMDLYLQAPSCMGILKGSNHVFELANPLYLQLVNKKDIIGKTVKEAFPELIGQGLSELLDKVYKTGNTFSANEMLIKLDLNGNGALVDTYLNFIYQAHRNHDGNIDGVVFFVNDVTEQVLSRRKIEESGKLYRQIVETAQEGIWMIDKDSRTTFVNKKMCEILEYTEEEMMGKAIYSFMDQEGQQIAGELMVKKMQGHVGQDHFKYISKSGKEIWANLSANPLFDEVGIYTGSLAMVTDITEKKEAELQLKQSNERYNLISMATNDMVWDWDLLTGKVYRNKEGWKKIFRTRDNEIENEFIDDWDNRIHPEDQEAVKKVNDEIQKSEKDFFEVECRMLRDDGTYAYIHDRANIIRNEEGKAVRLIGATQDITARKEAELQLAKSELRFRSLVQNSSELICIFNDKGYFKYSSPAIKHMLGFEPEDTIQKNAFAFVHPEDKTLLKDYLSHMKTGPHNKMPLLRFVNTRGEWRWIESTVTDMSDNPEVAGYVFNCRDVTDRIFLEKELGTERLLKYQEITKAVISAQEQERQELGGELHDNVNQILAGSLLYLGLAKKELNIDHEYLQETHTLINAAIEEIRNLSHSLIPPSLQKSEFLDALKNIIEVTQKTSGIIFSLHACGFDESSIPDKLKLTIYRIVQEQINNILKHAAAQKVIVRLVKDNEKTLLCIKDDGVGFDTGKKAGGVGLMNIKTRASLFNGDISIVSSPGKGCELRVLFN